MGSKNKKSIANRTKLKSAYPGGIDAVMDRMAVRRVPLDRVDGEGLPPLDVDLNAFTESLVIHPDKDPDEAKPFRSDYHRKRHALRCEFTDAPELAFLNGFLISHLRKSVWPDHAPDLFQRLWTEHGEFLIQHLDQPLVGFDDHHLWRPRCQPNPTQPWTVDGRAVWHDETL